jgi:thiamine biosynthesis lipoprotein ApbE
MDLAASSRRGRLPAGRLPRVVVSIGEDEIRQAEDRSELRRRSFRKQRAARARLCGIGVEDPERAGQGAIDRIQLSQGGLATSGDARRFVLHQGKRLGYILNPKTGWPIDGAPRSVTVIAPTCVEAGTLSTLAYLQGPGAKRFLEAEGVQFRLA